MSEKTLAEQEEERESRIGAKQDGQGEATAEDKEVLFSESFSEIRDGWSQGVCLNKRKGPCGQATWRVETRQDGTVWPERQRIGLVRFSCVVDLLGIVSFTTGYGVGATSDGPVPRHFRRLGRIRQQQFG